MQMEEVNILSYNVISHMLLELFVFFKSCMYIKTHSSVSAAKKQKIHETKKKYARAYQCVIYATGQVADFSLS